MNKNAQLLTLNVVNKAERIINNPDHDNAKAKNPAELFLPLNKNPGNHHFKTYYIMETLEKNMVTIATPEDLKVVEVSHNFGKYSKSLSSQNM